MLDVDPTFLEQLFTVQIFTTNIDLSLKYCSLSWGPTHNLAWPSHMIAISVTTVQQSGCHNTVKSAPTGSRNPCKICPESITVVLA